MTTPAALRPALDAALTSLWQLATDNRFQSVVTDSFGQSLNWTVMNSLRSRWASRNEDWIPQIQFLSGSSMPTAKGAYAARACLKSWEEAALGHFHDRLGVIDNRWDRSYMPLLLVRN